MNGNGSQHPARSVEFLSRLHDGELDPSERARFEAHRAHCAECRRTAVEFEDAISLFRASRSTPPRADLAARILRKVQSTNRPRAPFSPRFRLDLALGALAATALLTLLVTTPIVVRRAETPPAAPAADVLESRAPVRITISQAPKPPVASRERVRARIPPRPAPPAEKNETGQVVGEAAAPRERGAQAPARSAGEPVEAQQRSDRPSRAVASEAARAGGAEEPSTPPAREAPLRLTIHAIDGYGSAPPLLSEHSVQLSAEERGREYVLLVDSQGTVREVGPSPSPPSLSRLHFRPGNRPRRLLVRIE